MTSELRGEGTDNSHAFIEFDPERRAPGQQALQGNKIRQAYSGEERYFAQLALNKLSFLVYNRQLTDTSQLLHKLVQLYVEEEGLSYERLIKV